MPQLFLLLATCAWGLSFPLVKVLREQFYGGNTQVSALEQSAAFVFLRFALSALIFLLFFYVDSKRRSRTKFSSVLFSREELKLGAKLGLLGGLGLLFQTDGMAYTAPGTSAFLTQMTCVAVPFLALIGGKKKMSWMLFWALLSGLTGIYLLSGFEAATFTLGRGEAETLICACFFTAQIIALENSSSSSLNSLASTFWMFVFFALVNLPFINPSRFVVPALAPLESVFLLLLLVFIASLFPFAVMTKWQPKVSGTEATFIYSLESIFALVLSLLLTPILLKAGFASTGESITTGFAVGALLLIMANVLLYGESIVHKIKKIRRRS